MKGYVLKCVADPTVFYESGKQISTLKIFFTGEINMKKTLLFAFTLAMTAALTSCGAETGSSAGANTSFPKPPVAETTAVETAATTVSETAAETTKHESPMETVSFTMGNEKCDINEMLDYDSHKTYKASMSDFVKKGDKVESFEGANNAIGTLVLKFQTAEELEYAITHQKEWLKVIVK